MPAGQNKGAASGIWPAGRSLLMSAGKCSHSVDALTAHLKLHKILLSICLTTSKFQIL